jgi:hypothetical protein
VKTIWKYATPLYKLGGEIVHQMPQGADTISVAVVNDDLAIYVVVDDDIHSRVTRRFLVVGTGRPLRQDIEPYSHVGTATFRNGTGVLHVFDLGEDLHGES